jgi:hypothetical protein
MILFIYLLLASGFWSINNPLTKKFAKTHLDNFLGSLVITTFLLLFTALFLAYANILFAWSIILLHMLLLIGSYQLIKRKISDNKTLISFNVNNTIFIVVLIIYLLGIFTPSSLIAPVQSDGNSYTLLGILISKSNGLNLPPAFDKSQIESLQIQDDLIISRQLYNENTLGYSLVGMPLFPVTLSLIPTFSSWEFIRYSGFFLGVISLIIFYLIASLLFEKRYVFAGTLTIFALNPAQQILLKKAFNESLVQPLLLALVLISLTPELGKIKKYLISLVLFLLIATRAEMIFILVIWIGMLLFKKKFAASFFTVIGSTVIMAINIYLNREYYIREIFLRLISFIQGNFLKSDFPARITNFTLFGLGVLALIIATILLFIYFRKTIISTVKRFPLKAFLLTILWSTVGFGIVRIAGFLTASNFSYDERLISLFPIEFMNFENIILLRLGLFIPHIALVLGLIGFSYYVIKEKKISYATIIIVMYFVLLLATSQHDPNVVPWSRRYILLPIPMFILFFGYICEILVNSRIQEFIVRLLIIFVSFSVFSYSNFFMFNHEYADSQQFIKEFASNDKIKDKILLFDISADSGTLSNVKFCETLKVIYNTQCYYVSTPFITLSPDIKTEDIRLVTLNPSLDSRGYGQISSIEYSTRAYENTFYSRPRTVRAGRPTIYIYEFLFKP